MSRAILVTCLLLLLAGCTAPLPVDDPYAVLASANESPRRHMGAMIALDATPDDPEYLAALDRIMWAPGYVPDIREEAFDRLLAHDEAKLRRRIRNELPRTGARIWQERLCELIVAHGWTDLSPALVSSWARPIRWVDDYDRVEYHALEQLHGADEVVDVVFGLLLTESSRPFLRPRCWDLLMRLGEVERLRGLLAEVEPDTDDALLADLKAAAADLAAFPRNREEILWVRRLREPKRRGFYEQAAEVVATLEPDLRAELELRDLPIVVAAAAHEPQLLDTSKESLFAEVESHVRASRHHIDDDRFKGFPGAYGQRLHDHRERLTWGDLAAMRLAVRAIRVPQVADHLFDYAERDRADRSCEYGGIIRLDGRDRFEIIEFPPRFRRHDNEFVAPQAMLDQGYTALFHFHLHAQRYRNGEHAGPGIGDLTYARNLRTNCLVFTFIDADTLNVDFYRYDRVIVDLGEVARPASSS